MRKLVAYVLLLVSLAGKLRADEGVLELSDDTFQDAIDKHAVILIEFYAPWCGHCKSLAPQYEKAALILAKNDPPVVLAKIDGTRFDVLAQEIGITGFPTIFFYKNGVQYAYDGPRDADGIVGYMRKIAAPNWEAPQPDVLKLTWKNFTTAIYQNELLMVAFVIDGCPYCQKLKPEYDQAAKLLKQGSITIPLAMVDCSVEKDIATQFGIEAYPEMKVFRKGRQWSYTGPRTATSISQYMQAALGDPSREFRTVKDWLTAQSQEDVTVVGIFDGDDEPLYDTFLDVAFEFRHEYHFTHSFAVTEFKRQFPEAQVPCILLVQPTRFVTLRRERGYHVYTGSPSDIEKYQPAKQEKEAATTREQRERAKRAVKVFLDSNAVPLVGQFTKRNAHSLYAPATRRPLCLFFFTVDWTYDHREATQRWRTLIAERVALRYRDTIKSNLTFAIADEDEFADSVLQDLRASDSGTEMTLGCFDWRGRRFRMDEFDEFDPEAIHSFVDAFLAGSLKPIVLSARPPIASNAYSKVDGAYVLVGDTFERQVLADKQRDTLLYLYSTRHCPPCIEFEPIFTKLSLGLKSNEKQLLVAKMNMVDNEVSSDAYLIDGLPQLYFAPRSNKNAPVRYVGDRTFDKVAAWVEEQSGIKVGRATKEEL